MVDLKVSIEAKPPRALPGDLVTFVIQVANTGNRDADRAEIHAVLGQCCDTKERRYDWFPTIPAGHTATVQFAEHLPAGCDSAGDRHDLRPERVGDRRSQSGRQRRIDLGPPGHRSAELRSTAAASLIGPAVAPLCGPASPIDCCFLEGRR